MEKTKKKNESMMVLSLLVNGMLCGSVYYGIFSFMPLYVQQHFNNQLTASDVSIAMSSFYIS